MKMGFFGKLNRLFFPGSATYEPLGAGKKIALGFQHAFAMSCATILVPLLTDLDVGVALLCAGIGTLIFHLCTGGKNPVFLGSSFAFIAAIQGIVGNPSFGETKKDQISVAMWGIIAAGAVYLVIALLVRLFGKRFIDRLFPPVVRGVGIVLIGLNLAGSAINNIQTFENFTPGYYWSWGIALFVCLLAIILSSYGKGMLKMSSIVISLVSGYLVTLIAVETGLAPEGLTDFAKVSARSWLEVPDVTLPTFDFAGRGDQILRAVASVAPIAIVTVVEHVGDVYANGAVVGRDFTKDPGLHRTMLGDGLATMAAGVLGGPPNTTYSENTAVLAATGNYNPVTLRIAALIAIVVSFFGKAIGVIETIPTCVLGGACIVLYGMISSVGLRTLVENHVDFTKNRNLCIAAVMLVLAIGEAVIGGPNFSLTNIGLGIIAGILLNLILPEPKEPDPSLIAHTVEESEIVEERK
ncbi:MAG: uracil-xanthine permease family protein [Candidatus Woodwardiibium sp.]